MLVNYAYLTDQQHHLFSSVCLLECLITNVLNIMLNITNPLAIRCDRTFATYSEWSANCLVF